MHDDQQKTWGCMRTRQPIFDKYSFKTNQSMLDFKIILILIQNIKVFNNSV